MYRVWFAISAGLIVLLLAPHGSAAKGDDSKIKQRYEMTTVAEGSYSSNFYHVKNRRLDQFATKADPGERFSGMRGPADYTLRLGVDFESRWKLAKKRRVELGASVDYYRPVLNGIASYVDLGVSAGYRPTKGDQLKGKLGFIPNRFRKNYRYDSGGTKTYLRADYRQVDSILSYERRFSRAFRMELDYRLKLRRFEPPFANHDDNSHRGRLTTSLRRLGPLRLDVGGGYEQRGTGDGIEQGIRVDRSRRATILFMDANIDLPAKMELSLAVEYERRSYTTDEPADISRYNRVDHHVEGSLGWNKKVASDLYAQAELGWVRNRSNREQDPRFATEEVSYSELLATIGVAYRY